MGGDTELRKQYIQFQNSLWNKGKEIYWAIIWLGKKVVLLHLPTKTIGNNFLILFEIGVIFLINFRETKEILLLI
jgi:hypothetical protein